MALTRETKLGLVVAGSFVCLLGVLIARKMLQESPPGAGGPPDAVARAAITPPAKPAEKVASKPANGSATPTAPATQGNNSDIQLATLQTPAPRTLPTSVTTNGNRTEPNPAVPVPQPAAPGQGNGLETPVIPAPAAVPAPETQGFNVPIPGKPAADVQLQILEKQKQLMQQREQEAAAAAQSLLGGDPNTNGRALLVAQGPQPPSPPERGTTAVPVNEPSVPIPPAVPAPVPPPPASETTPAVPAPLPQGSPAPPVPPATTTPPAPAVPPPPVPPAAPSVPDPAPAPPTVAPAVPPAPTTTTPAPVPPSAPAPVPPIDNRNTPPPAPVPAAPPGTEANQGAEKSPQVNLTPPVPMAPGQTNAGQTGQVTPPVVPMGNPATDVVPRGQGIVVPPVPATAQETAAVPASGNPRPLPAVGTAPIAVPQLGGNGGTPVVKDYTLDTYRCEAGVTSFEQISSKFYYSPRYGRALLLFNRKLPTASAAIKQDPPQLTPGERIVIPPAYILEQVYRSEIGQPSTTGVVPASVPPAAAPAPVPPAPAPAAATPREASSSATPPAPQTGPTHTVRPGGELLYEIARERLGDGRRWVEIYRLNPTLTVEGEGRIPPGTVLKLPTASRAIP